MGQGYFHIEPDTKKWSVQFSYKDYYGNTKRKHKRGFATKRDAKQFMDEFILKQQSNIDMSFASFLDEYKENMYSDLRDSTIATKTHMIELHILVIKFFSATGRHSHISHLIDLGFSAVAIADRVGHESIDITYRYSHLFPSKQVAMADKLDEVNAEFEDMDSEADEHVDAGDIREAAGKIIAEDMEESAEMIDLDAVDICNSKKSASNGSGKVLSIEKYRAV